MNLIYIILLLSIHGFHAYTQTQYLNSFITYSTDQGLPSNSVYSVVEDDNGFMWFGTADGLCRFDGYKIKVYRNFSSDFQSNRRNFVRRLFKSSKGTLWIGMEYGIVKFDKLTGRFDGLFNFSPLVGNHATRQTILPYYELTDGSILAFNSSYQNLVIHPQTDSVNLYFKDLPLLQSASPIAYDQNRILYLNNGKLILYSPALGKHEFIMQTEFIHFLNPGTGCLDGNNLYLAYEEKIIQIDLIKKAVVKEIVFFDKHHPLNRVAQMKLSPDREFIILGTKGSGVFFLNKNLDIISNYRGSSNLKSTLESDIIECLYIDKMKNLWIGTDLGGVSVQPYNNRFGYYTKAAYDKFISCITVTENYIYSGVYNEGLYQTHRFTGKTRLVSLRRNPRNIRYLKEINGLLYIGSEQGIMIYHPANEQCEFMYPMDANEGNIRSMFSMSPDSLLITTSFSLFSLKKTEKGWKSTKLLSYIHPAGIIKGFKNEIIICNKNKVLVKDTIRLSPYLVKVGDLLMLERTSAAIRYNDCLWIAGIDGLVKLNSSYFPIDTLNDDNSKIKTKIMSMELMANNLWISTNNGLIQYCPDDGRMFSYDINDGLPSDEFISTSSFQDINGMLYFGTTHGMVTFYPDSIKPNANFSRPVITNIKLFNKELLDSNKQFIDSLVLDYHQNTIYVEFSSPNPALQYRIHYAYQLGNKGKWMELGTDRSVWLSHLKPGKYTLNIKVTSPDGLWSDSFRVLYIYIRPPFWQTWWFLLLMIALGLVIIVTTVYQISTWKQRRKIKQLESEKLIQEERLRISKDLHDELGSGLSKIRILAEMMDHENPDIQLKNLKSIQETSAVISSNLKDLIWVLDSKDVNLESMIADIRAYSMDYLEELGVEVSFEITNHLPVTVVSKMVYRNLFMVVKESLQNIAKHAEAGKVFIRVLFGDTLHITIQDNGKGFHQPVTYGNGLRNMKSRITQLGGTFHIKSNSSGTFIDIDVPVVEQIPHK